MDRVEYSYTKIFIRIFILCIVFILPLAISIGGLRSNLNLTLLVWMCGYILICYYVYYHLRYDKEGRVYITKSSFVTYGKSDEKVIIDWPDLIIENINSNFLSGEKILWVSSKKNLNSKFPFEVGIFTKESLTKLIKTNLYNDNVLYLKLASIYPEYFS